MTNIVEFPGLGISWDVPRVAFTLFGIPIYWYGVCIGLGMLLALIMAFSQAKRFGIDSNRMVDVIFVGLICAIVCGRLFYVIFSDQDYSTFWQLIDLRSGGIAIYGGIIGAFVGAGITCKIRKVPVLPLFDLAGMGFLIGQACGRWGNFFNQEAFGVNTTLPWGMISPTTSAYLQARQQQLAAEGIIVDPSMPVHPTFLYESLWCVIGFLALFLYRKRRKFNGELFLLYVLWYGIGRALIEGLRTDSLMIGGLGLRVSQVIAIASALVALVLLVIGYIRSRGKPLVVPALPPYTTKVKIDTPQGPQKVEISWPAEEKEPSKAERQRMAMEAYTKQRGDAISDTPAAETQEPQAENADGQGEGT